MYFYFASGARVLDSLMIVGYATIPIFTSSMSSEFGTNLGSFATFLGSKSFSNGTRALGIAFPLSCRISLPHKLLRYSCCSSGSGEFALSVFSSPSSTVYIGMAGSSWTSSLERIVWSGSISLAHGSLSGGESLPSIIKPSNSPVR